MGQMNAVEAGFGNTKNWPIVVLYHINNEPPLRFICICIYKHL